VADATDHVAIIDHGVVVRADGAESEHGSHFKVGDRVCWKGDATNQGTIKGTALSGVTIVWDDGDANSISHNDMAKVERVPVKV
jgi:hypothetical protein